MLAPDSAIGWTHIWAEGEQIPISDAMAVALVVSGLIEYSPEDGPNARVYRPRDGVTLRGIKKVMERKSRK